MQTKTDKQESLKPQVKYRLDYVAPDFTITDIELEFNLAPEITTVTAISKIKRLNPIATKLVLDGENLKLEQLLINNSPWQHYEVNATQLIIHDLPEAFTLKIVNQIKPIENTALQGLYVSGEALCTQCEAEGFRNITYYLDRPDVLAKFTTKIIADKKTYPYLLSNGNRIEQGDLDKNTHYAIWQDPFPKPAYLFALVAGDFDRLEDTFITRSNRKIALEIFVDKGNIDRTSWAMTCLKNSMKWDEDRFNLEYDLDIFMIVAVDFFNMGAMENKGLNVFNSKFVLAKPETATDTDYLDIERVIGHEYFHNWTGNRVTCRDWFQLSLKEGLTVFRDQEFSADLGSRAVNRIDDVKLLRAVQFAEDASPMAHPIRPDQVIEMNNFYTVTVYEKGAEVIRMIHTLLGEEKFQAGMRLYFDRHDGSAATCDDFVQAMQDASAIDLTHFKKWYSQSGTPELTITDEYNAEFKTYTLTITQKTPATLDQIQKESLHIPFDIELYQADGSIQPLIINEALISSVLNLHQETETFIFEKIESRPIIAFLRNFSAPVKIKYDYCDENLVFLVKHATNEFNRYDALQILLAKSFTKDVEEFKKGQSIEFPLLIIDLFKYLLTSTSLDKALIAQMITLPTEVELSALFEIVDPEAIFEVRQRYLHQLGEALFDELLAVYHENLSENYELTHEAIAKRALKNSALFLLAFAKEEQTAVDKLVQKHYEQADNMTDCLAALNCATKAQLLCADMLMDQFDEKWNQNGLVMDKWFALQATSPADKVLKNVKHLLTHRSFSIKNPNRVRALIGTFVMNNPHAFHQLNGKGYAFLTEILEQLNVLNPQVASRISDPLIRFNRYDSTRQMLMKLELEKLLTIPNLSNDLYEKVMKALA